MNDSLIDAVNSNPNLPELIKQHIIAFVGSVEEMYPDFDYNEFDRILSTINFEEGKTEGYSTYDRPRNTLIVDTKEVLEDGIDLQHLIFNQILLICTGKVGE